VPGKQEGARILALRPGSSSPASPEDKRAAREAAQQDVFLREVDEALRQDQAVDLLKRYGLPIGAAVALGLAAFAGVLWWNHASEQTAAEHGEKLTLALDEVDRGRIDQADKNLSALAADAKDGTKAAAMLLRAGIAQQQGRNADAVKLFAAVAADAEAPQPYRDLALIREVAAGYDSLPPQQVIDRLKKLAVPGNPWFGSAGELVGMAYLAQNRADLAGPLFAAMSRDKDVPESMRSRARQMAGLLGVDAIDDVAKAAGTQPAQ
jgi:hypothetical protein